jgi:chitodextrinase
MFTRKSFRRDRRRTAPINSAVRSTIESLEGRTLLAADFTIATLSDTQYSVESFPATFPAQTAWVAAHGIGGTANDAFANNIAFFAHQGDMLRRGYSNAQAAVADAALNNLNEKVPYTVSIGNHDYDNQFDDLDQHVSSANFTSWFGNARYQGISNSGFGGSSIDQRNRFQTFTAGGQEFLVLSLEWEPSNASIAWAQTVINSHRQDPVIISTHEYLNSSGRTTSTLEPDAGYNAGEAIYQKLVKPNSQVFMVLSGHTGAIRSQTSLNNAGSSVYEIVADFEGRNNGGDGWMQLLGFDLAGNKIVETNYSPTLNQSEAGTTFSNVNFNQRFSFYTAGAPISNDDTVDITPGDVVTFDPRANDVDSDGVASSEAISFSTLPADVSYDANTGLFTYAPAAGFRGDVSFTYTLNDGTNISNTAAVTLRANNAPTAADDSAATLESKSVTINVKANDSDDNVADNAALAPILASLPAHGAVLADTGGTFTYTPDPKFVGIDTFTYSLSDGKIAAAPVTVTVNVAANPPVYNYPISETTSAGQRTGSYANLTASDGNVESIKEVISSGVDVDQRWRFNVTPGTDMTLAINASRSFSNPGTGDEYHLRYSTNGSAWYDLTVLTPSGRGSKDITRTKFDASEPYQLYALPSSLSGTVYIRATDVNTSGTETADTLTVDEIFIRSGVAAPDTTPPSVPLNLQVTATTASSIALAWNASTDDRGVAGYDVYRDGTTYLATVTATSFTDTGLAASTQYSYTVVARDAAGNLSDTSSPVSATTSAVSPLSPPTNLTGSKTSKKAKLTWRDNSATESGFHVYSSTDGFHWSLISTVSARSGSGGTQTCTTGNLASGTWYFKVTTFDANGESDPSNIFSIRI